MGRIEIESKDDARARGSHSPDRAESLMLAYGRIVQAEQTIPIGEGADYTISPI
jgi:hypothetical protein